MTWKSSALISGVTLMATYFASVPARPVDVPQQRSRRATAEAVVAYDIQQQADRLQARLREQVAYQPPSRNPFRFNERRVASGATTGAPGAMLVTGTPSIPVDPPLPPVTLIGIAQDDADVVERTAVLKTSEGVVLVKKGDPVAGGYVVSAVGADAVELTDAAGAIRRVTF